MGLPRLIRVCPTILQGAGAKPGPLDVTQTAAVGAYGLRRLRRGYTGYAVEVRRTSDSARLNVGFTASGDFDLATYLGFIGGSSGTMRTWYDQSGAGNDLSQTTAALQPAIVLSGQAGHPILRFSGGTFLTRSSFSPTTMANLTAIGVVAMYSSPGVNGRLLSFTDTVGGNDFSAGISLSSVSTTAWDVGSAGAKGNPAVAKTFGFTSASFHQLSFWYATAGSGLVADQGTVATAATSTPSTAAATAFLDIGAGLSNASPGSDPLICDYAEMLFFAADLSAARNSIELNQRTYWSTP